MKKSIKERTIYLLKTSVFCNYHSKQVRKTFDTKKELRDFCIKWNLLYAFDHYENINNFCVSVWSCY